MCSPTARDSSALESSELLLINGETAGEAEKELSNTAANMFGCEQECATTANKGPQALCSASVELAVLQDSMMASRPSASSLSSSLSTEAGSGMCRICHEGSADEALLSPCYCSGSVKHVHQTCLERWLQAGGGGEAAGRPSGTGSAADTYRCELCGYNFVMTTRVKPFRKWKKLKMTAVERRKVLCSVTFHAVAITCVVWSLYVLIDRTTQEIQEGNLQWPFWTKLVVVAIGFTGGLVFMYVQCKMYVHLFRKWKAYNRIIQIQSFSGSTAEKVAPSSMPGRSPKPMSAVVALAVSCDT